MKLKIHNKYVLWGLTAFLVILASLFVYYLMFYGSAWKSGLSALSHVLMPVLMGLVMAYLLTPVLNFIEYRLLRPLCKLLKIKENAKRNSFLRGISILITVFLFVALIYSLVNMILSQIIPSIVSIVTNFDTYVSNFTGWLNKMMVDNPDMGRYIVRMVDRYSGELETWLNETVLQKTSEVIVTVSLSIISMLKVLLNFILGIMISLYVLGSKERFAGQAKKIAYALFEKDTANIIVNNFRFTHKTFIGFISGKVLDSILIGMLCFVGTSLLDTPYAALVSMVIGVTNIIPFFGPYLGAIPSIVLIFVVDPMHPLNCVYFAIFILVLQQIDGNIIGPAILGESTGLTGFWVIFSITLFGGLFGVLGMVVGVPFFAVIYAAIRSFINSALSRKKLPMESMEYVNLCAVDEEGLHKYTPETKKAWREKGDEKNFGKEFINRNSAITYFSSLLDRSSQQSQTDNAEVSAQETNRGNDMEQEEPEKTKE